MFELGKVTFYILRDKDGDTLIQYEATVIDFETHTELLRVSDTSNSIVRGAEYIAQGSSRWFAVHSCLSENGILKGE